MKYASFVWMTLLAVSFGAAASPKEGISDTKWEKAKQSYITLLSETNAGVKTSAANFIRIYNIVEAADALKKVLLCDNCETVKVSAALALLHIAGEEGKTAIKNALATEENEVLVAFYNVILQSDTEKGNIPISQN